MIGLIFVLSSSQLAHLLFSRYSGGQSLQVKKPDVMREKEKRASLARVIQPVTVHTTQRQLGCKYQGIHQNHSDFICIVIYHPNSFGGMQLAITNLYTMVQLLQPAYLVRSRQTEDQVMLKYTDIYRLHVL